MPDQKALIARLQTPKDENGERKDIFLRTSADAVIYKDPDTNEEEALTDVVEDVKDSVGDVKESMKKLEDSIGDIGSGTPENPVVHGMDVPFISSKEPTKSCLWLKTE